MAHNHRALPHFRLPAIGQLCGNGYTVPARTEDLGVACSRDILDKTLGAGLRRQRTLFGPLRNVVEVELLHTNYLHFFAASRSAPEIVVEGEANGVRRRRALRADAT